MRSTLYLKFIVTYIIFGFLCLFVTATLASQLTLSRLEDKTGKELYKNATVVATEYLPEYYAGNISASAVQTQFIGMRNYMDASVWLVDTEGKMVMSATSRNAYAPYQIHDFDPTELGNKQYLVGTYHDYFDEDMISIIIPVTRGFSVKGYLLVHKPYSDIVETKDIFMKIVYLTLIVIYLLSFMILLAFHFFVFRPLRQITEAAKQYASGNLDHEISVTSSDEMGYLSASLNYMSSQLKDMEDYQKKFIANVSHDFRSPLTSIKGYVEAMADGTIPPEMQGKYLDIILFETERLTDLTRDLLTLNEFDTKDLLLDRTVFDIHQVIKTTAASFEGTCTAKHISIELIFASKVLNVNADTRKIQQVLYNLLDNAIKFSPADSHITIETTDRNGKVFISVKDEGIGIPKNSLNKIWERFYKTDLSRGKDKKGTGLGLSIVKEIIQAHGENINVVSTEGVGTEFTFSLTKA